MESTNEDANIVVMLKRAENAIFMDNEVAKRAYNDVLDRDPENGAAWWGLLQIELGLSSVDNFICSMDYQTFNALRNSINYINAVKFSYREPKFIEFMRKLKGRAEEKKIELDQKRDRCNREKENEKKYIDETQSKVDKALAVRETKKYGVKSLALLLVASLVIGGILWAAVALWCGILVAVLLIAGVVLLYIRNHKLYRKYTDNQSVIAEMKPTLDRYIMNLPDLEDYKKDVDAAVGFFDGSIVDCNAVCAKASVSSVSIDVQGSKALEYRGGWCSLDIDCIIAEQKYKNGDYVAKGVNVVAVASGSVKEIHVSSREESKMYVDGKRFGYDKRKSVNLDNFKIRSWINAGNNREKGVFVKAGEELVTCSESEDYDDFDIDNNRQRKTRTFTDAVRASQDMYIIYANEKLLRYSNYQGGELLFKWLPVNEMTTASGGFIVYGGAQGEVINAYEAIFGLE